MARITSLRIADFRGIGADTSLGTDCTVLVGDNGSGKSSLVDAAEFALRGRLSRRSEGGRKKRREVRNLLTDRAPGVLVELSDGRRIKRGGGLREEDGRLYQQATMVEGFEQAPIAVRRQHIETFWNLSDEERKQFFFDYLRSDYRSIVRPEQIVAQEEKVALAERSLAAAREELLGASGLPPEAPPVPETTRAVNWWKRNVLDPHLRKARNKARKAQSHAAFGKVREGVVHRNHQKGVLDRLHVDAEAPEEDVTGILRGISMRVTEDFVAIAATDWISRIEIEAGDDQEFALSVLSSRGQRMDPVQTLSEAALDLLALLVLVEVHIECATLGQEKIIVLDDIFQSVDSVHRIRALDHLISRLRGWQVIITLHDRLWLNLATQAFSRANRSVEVYEVIGQGPIEPPIIRSTSTQTIDELRTHVTNRASSVTLCAIAGRVLEEACDKLSIKMESRVTRQPEGRYTLGNLWPSVKNLLLKKGPDPCRKLLADVDSFLVLRNLIGAHYNEWAGSLSSAEAMDFATIVVGFWDSVHCATCGRPFAKFKETGGSREFFDFACGPAAAHEKIAVTATPAEGA